MVDWNVDHMEFFPFRKVIVDVVTHGEETECTCERVVYGRLVGYGYRRVLGCVGIGGMYGIVLCDALIFTCLRRACFLFVGSVVTLQLLLREGKRLLVCSKWLCNNSRSITCFGGCGYECGWGWGCRCVSHDSPTLVHNCCARCKKCVPRVEYDK